MSSRAGKISDVPDDSALWSLVVPVKRLEIAKSRLGAPYDDARGLLALAFARDTAQAALDCPRVARVLVVTNDNEVARTLRRLGADVLPDEPDNGLNAAIRHGIEAIAIRRRTARSGPVGVLTADLPALRTRELGDALSAAGDAAFVRDADGSGTTLLMARRVSLLAPMFGVDSATAHATWATEMVAGDSVRRDVDTAAHLDSARTLGLGPATTAMLARAPQRAARAG